MRGIDNKGKRVSVLKKAWYKGFMGFMRENTMCENSKNIVSREQVHKGRFDSQVVRLDVSAPRVVGLDVSVDEWSD